MTRFVRVLTAVTLVLSCAQAAAAQTADEIVEKHIAAIGGRAALAKLTSRTAHRDDHHRHSRGRVLGAD